MGKNRLGFWDYFILIIGIGFLMLMVSCYKDPICHTTHVGTIDKEIGGGQVEKTFIFETVCL